MNEMTLYIASPLAIHCSIYVDHFSLFLLWSYTLVNRFELLEEMGCRHTLCHPDLFPKWSSVAIITSL